MLVFSHGLVIEGAADTSRASGVQVARQWKTPRENLDCKVDNSRQARVGREYASFKFENSGTYRVVIPEADLYFVGEGSTHA